MTGSSGKRTGGFGSAMLNDTTLTLIEATLVEPTPVRMTHRLRRFANVR